MQRVEQVSFFQRLHSHGAELRRHRRLLVDVADIAHEPDVEDRGWKTESVSEWDECVKEGVGRRVVDLTDLANHPRQRSKENEKVEGPWLLVHDGGSRSRGPWER